MELEKAMQAVKYRLVTNVFSLLLFFLSIHIHIIQKNLKIYSYVLTFRFIRMEIVNKDFKIFYVSGFNYALKNVSYFFRVSFRDL